MRYRHVKLLLRGLDCPLPPSVTVATVPVTDTTNAMDNIAVNGAGWQHQEDVVILEYVRKNGPKWSNMTRLLPGRTENGCRNRYIRMQKSVERFGKIVDGRRSGYRCNSRMKRENTTEWTMETYDTNSVHSSDGEDEVLLVQPCSEGDEYEALPYEASLGIKNFDLSDFDYSLGDDRDRVNYETWRRNMALSMRSETPVGDLMEAMEAWCQTAR